MKKIKKSTISTAIINYVTENKKEEKKYCATKPFK